MPKNNKTESEQLQLFPGWDPRQLELFHPEPRRVFVPSEDFDRLDALTGPCNERIWEAEHGD